MLRRIQALDRQLHKKHLCMHNESWGRCEREVPKAALLFEQFYARIEALGILSGPDDAGQTRRIDNAMHEDLEASVLIMRFLYLLGEWCEKHTGLKHPQEIMGWPRSWEWDRCPLILDQQNMEASNGN